MHQHGQGQRHGGGLHAALSGAGARWHPPQPDDVLLALDDTDNLDSPGTGFRARELSWLLAQAGLGRPIAISRHQLLVDPRIPYTSHNSSACIVLTRVRNAPRAFELAREYLADNAAPGSDVGVVMTRRCEAPPALASWGARAKREVLELSAARALASEGGTAHAELSGTGGGLIGALAAVGLNAAGNDGRLLWLRSLRELAGQRLPLAELAEYTGLAVETLEGRRVGLPEALIELGDWPRAIYRNHQPVLLVERNHEYTQCVWRSVPREVVKQF